MAEAPPKDPPAFAEPPVESAGTGEPAEPAPAAEPAAAEPAEPAPIEWPASVANAEPDLAPPAPPPRITPWVTYSLVAINVLAWGLSIANGADPFSPTPQQIFALGGNMGTATLEGEEWRLFTSMFLHYGILHIGMNMLGLVGGGALAERLFGRLGFATIYLVSGLAGSLATALRPGVVSAGASGAIFGVVGAVVVYYARFHKQMHANLAKEAGGLFAFIGYNLLFGFTQEGIDMYAHIGGLVAGAAVGLALGIAPAAVTEPAATEPAATEPAPRSRRLPRVAIVAAVGLVAVFAGAMLAPTPVHKDTVAVRTFADAETAILERWKELAMQIGAGKIDDVQLADAIDHELLPRWREATDALAATQLNPELQQKLRDYTRARQEGWELMSEALRKNEQEKFNRGLARFREAEELLK